MAGNRCANAADPFDGLRAGSAATTTTAPLMHRKRLTMRAAREPNCHLNKSPFRLAAETNRFSHGESVLWRTGTPVLPSLGIPQPHLGSSLEQGRGGVAHARTEFTPTAALY